MGCTARRASPNGRVCKGRIEHDIATGRTVTIAGADRLHAAFNADCGSRLEGSYRFIAS